MKDFPVTLDDAISLIPKNCTASIMVGNGRDCIVQIHHFLEGAMIPHRMTVATAGTPVLAMIEACEKATPK